MGISQWKSKPTIRHMPLQGIALTLGVFPSLSFFTIVLGADTFNLQFFGTAQTSCDHWFFASCVG
tara:strand:- start:61 stop:255 length:195 start_codon:yes stop_codon:yes gene_type:complete